MLVGGVRIGEATEQDGVGLVRDVVDLDGDPEAPAVEGHLPARERAAVVGHDLGVVYRGPRNRGREDRQVAGVRQVVGQQPRARAAAVQEPSVLVVRHVVGALVRAARDRVAQRDDDPDVDVREVEHLDPVAPLADGVSLVQLGLDVPVVLLVPTTMARTTGVAGSVISTIPVAALAP